MLNSFMNMLFGCPHNSTTFPITPARRAGGSTARHGTYVVCLDCGKEFAYNWSEMRIGEPVAGRVNAEAEAAYSVAER
jgi:hypothetical protein